MRINDVIQCAFLMRQSAESLYFVAKRLEENGKIDYHRAGEMSIECANAFQVFRTMGCRCLGKETFDARLEALAQPTVPFEVH